MQPMLNSFQRKHRQKMRARTLAQMAVLGLLALAAWASYRFGAEQAIARMGQKAIELEHVVEERDALRERVVDLEAKSIADSKKLDDAERRYREEIPDDQVRALIALARDKRAAGVSVERLTTVLAAAGNPRNCRDRDTKRFYMATPLGQGGSTQNWVGFGNGAITVTGEGASALSAEKKPEAWYDPKQPVKMTFKLIGGKVSVVEGNLPLQHSIIDDNVEYRFTVGPNATRGFIEVSGVTCDYP